MVLWMGVFAAMKESVAQGIVNTIQTGAENTARFALKAFRYAPIFPIKIDRNEDGDTDDAGEQFGSFADVVNLSKIPSMYMDKKEQDSRDDIRKHAKSMLGIDLDGGTANMRDFLNTNNKNDVQLKQALERLTQGDSELTKDEIKKIVEHLQTGGHISSSNAAAMMKMDDAAFRKALNDQRYVTNRTLLDGIYNYNAVKPGGDDKPAKLSDNAAV